MVEKSQQKLYFPVIHQYWMDSGLMGFYSLAKKMRRKYPEIKLIDDDKGVYLEGTDEQLEKFLNDVYQALLDEYYNTSSPKQIEENAGFYYDTEKDSFVRFPKVKTTGIAEIIFSKAPRPTGYSDKYRKENGKNYLPETYAHLQDRFGVFLEENKLKADVATFLINGRNAYQPKVTLAVTPKKANKTCYMCGCQTHSADEVSSTVFPLITSSAGIKSFNSECENPFKVCWKCEYIAKFVPVTGYYSKSGDDTFIYFVYSDSFEKMNDVFSSKFSGMQQYDENRYRNFKEPFSYLQKVHERFFSFLYTVYITTCMVKAGDEQSELDLDALLEINVNKSPVSYYVLHFQKLGDTYVGKTVWEFTEAIYLFRLFSELFKKGVDLKAVMQNLVDYEQTKNESKTIIRNRVCERILKKQHLIDLIEPFVYHVNRSKTAFIKNIFDFVIEYEHILYEGDSMKQELIDTASSLGKSIGLTLGAEGKKARGDLFRLRKARKPEDFLNEINRIQMKYGISVTADVYNKGEVMDENFKEFKGFCMVAALNSFNARNSSKTEGGE